MVMQYIRGSTHQVKGRILGIFEQIIQNSHIHNIEIAFPYTRKLNLKFGDPGGRLNKKDGLTRYGNSHVKDKTS